MFLLNLFASRRPIVLLYHGVQRTGDGINAAVFERHIRFLTRHCVIVPSSAFNSRRRAFEKVRVILTFDDGFRNNAEVAVPILRQYRVPALFFACSRHTQPGRLLWFAYLCALKNEFRKNGFSFGGAYWDMRTQHRAQTLARLRTHLCGLKPHPAAMYQAIEEELPPIDELVSSSVFADRYAGMTEEQLRELASDPLFEVGAHTSDHAILSLCESEERKRQIEMSKAWLESLQDRPCTTFAYPAGDYDEAAMACCVAAGIKAAFAVECKTDRESMLDIQRYGLYAPHITALACKVFFGHLLRRLGFRIG